MNTTTGRPIGLAILVWGLVLSSAIRAADGRSSALDGIYVNRDHTCGRVEFLPDGKCNLKVCSGYYTATYRWEADTCVVKADESEEAVRLTRSGEGFVDDEGKRWVPRGSVVKMPWTDLAPVTLTVVDDKTGRPVREFSYEYTLAAPNAEYDPLLPRRTEVRAENGSFTIDAPASCEIGLYLEGPDLVGGYGSHRRIDVKSGAGSRKIEVRVEVGVTVTGIVVEAGTGRPIAGATVAPLVFTPPLFSPNRRQAVETDQSGRFSVRGVDPDFGVKAWHPDHLDSGETGCKVPEKGKEGRGVRIELRTGGKIVGTVVDAAGAPLEGVRVSDGAGKEALTGADGVFALMSPGKQGGNDGAFDIRVEKDGYIRQAVRSRTAARGNMKIALAHCPVLSGEVVGAKAGPVASYEIWAGPGPEPEEWACASQRVNRPDGRFSVTVDTGLDFAETKKIWVGVRAPGHALWETVQDSWNGSTSMTIRLDSGVSVVGRVAWPAAGKSAANVRLAPVTAGGSRRSERTVRQSLGTSEVAIGGDDRFSFTHVKPGLYTLAVHGETLSPSTTTLAVPDSGADAGVVGLRGTGVVIGRAHMPRGCVESGCGESGGPAVVWTFADGEIVYDGCEDAFGSDGVLGLKPISFKADENGRFRVKSVPAGTVVVSIPYNISADVIGSHSRFAQVLEGRETEIRFFDPSGAWNLPFEFVIGDGSKSHFASGTGMGGRRKVENITTRAPMLLIELQPVGTNAVSFAVADWEELDRENRITLPDVHPGRYRVRVADWFGSRGFDEGSVFEGVIDAPPTSGVVRVNLGAGTVTGRIRWTGENRRRIHVMALGSRAGARLRHARCDGSGNFCLRYLDPDTYTVMAHDHGAGWCRIDEVRVRDNVSDVGTRTLVPGATLTGKIEIPAAGKPLTGVVASDTSGFAVEADDLEPQAAGAYAVSGLWPGRWTLKLRRGEEVLHEAQATIAATNTVILNLVPGTSP